MKKSERLGCRQEGETEKPAAVEQEQSAQQNCSVGLNPLEWSGAMLSHLKSCLTGVALVDAQEALEFLDECGRNSEKLGQALAASLGWH